MKKLITLFIAVLVTLSAYSQGNSGMSLEQKQILDGSWYKESPESGKIGIDLQGAKDLLKKRKMKKVPVVALIGTGADIEHEALKNSVWVNPKEKADGKDNDNNGYADDINGWNFIGSKDGSSMEFGIQEANREWLRLKDKYADILFDGKRYFKYENGVRVYIAAPEDIEEFNYFTKIIRERDGSLSGLYGGYIIAFLVKEYTQEWDKEIQLKFPGKTRKEITSDEFFAAVDDKNGPQDSLKNIALTLVSLYSSFGKTMRNNPNYVTTWSDIYENFTDRQIKYAKESYDKIFEKNSKDDRQAVVGDDPYNIEDTKYGNNTVLTGASLSGTMFSGIIAGQDVNGKGFSGIIPEAKIMNLVTSAQSGDPYLKDIALAVRYAVNKGADIIVLPQQSLLYHSVQKSWVYDAIRDAENKGILVIAPAWEKSENMDTRAYYPRREDYKGKPMTNIMIVANSDSKGNPSPMSNYGKYNLDTYVPGVNIYSTAPGDIYRTGTSSSMGAVVTAGAAAFIKAYFPELTGSQIRELLINSVTSKRGTEIEKSVIHNGKRITDLFLFEQLCTSSGILNLRNSVEAALKNMK